MPRPKLSNIPLASLQKEIQRRMANLDGLKAQRDRLDKELESIDRQIAQLGGKAAPANGRRKKAAKKAGRRRKRATGKTLPEYIKSVLGKAKKPMRVKDVEAAVRKAGYPTKSKQFYTQVAAALRDGKEFRKIKRGVYELAGKKAGKKTAKPKAKAAPATKPAAKGKRARRRRKYSQTAEQFLLGLLKGKAATSAEINAAWQKARTGRADNTLNKMVKDKKVKREKLPKGKGSTYSLA